MVFGESEVVCRRPLCGAEVPPRVTVDVLNAAIAGRGTRGTLNLPQSNRGLWLDVIGSLAILWESTAGSLWESFVAVAPCAPLTYSAMS